jgi:uncharacterized surface protein with fasciclin (FAS1) repeats
MSMVSLAVSPRLYWEPTLNGTQVDVEGTALNGDQANIVATDIEASNGIVHVIDGVLLPESFDTP